MWTANAATVSPSADTADGRVHFTPANLRVQFHRSIEPPATAAVLRQVFSDPNHFVHHDPLPSSDQYGDEGVAKHNRLHTDDGLVHLFVFGIEHRRTDGPAPQRFPARQTKEASVSSYLFNSQLLEEPDGAMVLVAPSEGEHDERVRKVCEKWCVGDTPIRRVEWMNVRESMRNGGGPACLRLRVPLKDAERSLVHSGVALTSERADALEAWITRWYPDSLQPEDLVDPGSSIRCRDAMKALEDITGIPAFPV